MKKRYRLIRRESRGGKLYLVDTLTNKRESLKTTSEADAQQILHARNEAERQPIINKQIAKAYLAASDSSITKRTWQDAFDAIINAKTGETQARWKRAAKEKPFDLIRKCVIVETQADQLLMVLKAGTVSTNVHLRKLHNFCLDMNWLPWPIIGAPAALLPDAGLFHSVYGTEHYLPAALPLSKREAVRDLIGNEAEEVVWLFCFLRRETFNANLTQSCFSIEHRSTAKSSL